MMSKGNNHTGFILLHDLYKRRFYRRPGSWQYKTGRICMQPQEKYFCSLLVYILLKYLARTTFRGPKFTFSNRNNWLFNRYCRFRMLRTTGKVILVATRTFGDATCKRKQKYFNYPHKGYHTRPHLAP